MLWIHYAVCTHDHLSQVACFIFSLGEVYREIITEGFDLLGERKEAL